TTVMKRSVPDASRHVRRPGTASLCRWPIRSRRRVGERVADDGLVEITMPPWEVVDGGIPYQTRCPCRRSRAKLCICCNALNTQNLRGIAKHETPLEMDTRYPLTCIPGY